MLDVHQRRVPQVGFPQHGTGQVRLLQIRPAQIGSKVDRILERAIRQQSMPFNNKTGMTPAERGELAKWIDSGARLE